MKLEAMKRQGARADLTSRQVVGKLETADAIGKDVGESGRQIQRFIRLTYLVPPLLDMVDEHKVAFNPAVELSYLTSEEQVALLDAMDSEQSTPSLSQAQRLKKFSRRAVCPKISCALFSPKKRSRRSARSPCPVTSCAATFQRATPPSRWNRPSFACWNSGRDDGSGIWSGRKRHHTTKKPERTLLRLFSFTVSRLSVERQIPHPPCGKRRLTFRTARKAQPVVCPSDQPSSPDGYPTGSLRLHLSGSLPA